VLLAETTEYGVHFKTGMPVVVRFVRNAGKAPPPLPGDPYQQRIEPAGRYMVHNPDPGKLTSGWLQGTVTFESPLVLAFNAEQNRYYDDGSWKKQLERFFRKRGRSLSRAVFRAGYDGIVTVMPDTNDTREIVDLTWLRLQP
jgi:hypothetical protein